MKKLIVCLGLVAFASVCALQAGESKDKNKGACADQAKTGCQEKSACCDKDAKKVAFKKTYDPSVKGAMLLVKK